MFKLKNKRGQAMVEGTVMIIFMFLVFTLMFKVILYTNHQIDNKAKHCINLLNRAEAILLEVKDIKNCMDDANKGHGNDCDGFDENNPSIDKRK